MTPYDQVANRNLSILGESKKKQIAGTSLNANSYLLYPNFPRSPQTPGIHSALPIETMNERIPHI